MKKSFDVTAIMCRAWEVRREAAAKAECKVSEVLMGECLKIAWAESEGANAEFNAVTLAGEWEALTDDQKVSFMSACIRKAAKNTIGYSEEDHYLQFSEVPAFGCYRPHDFDEFVSEVTIRVMGKLGNTDKLTAVNQKRAAQGERPLALVNIVYNAARAAIAAVYYQDSKHSAAYDRQLIDSNGDTCSMLETVCGDPTQNTETSAVIRLDLERYASGLDDIGRQILELVGEHKTEREIGRAVGISNVAVHKRIVKMRAALQELRMA